MRWKLTTVSGTFYRLALLVFVLCSESVLAQCDPVVKTKLFGFPPTRNAQFGWDVAADGRLAIFGAPTWDYYGDSQGFAYIFECDDQGEWHEIVKLRPNDLDAEADFGFSVDIRGDHAVVGAPWAVGRDGIDQTGAAYVFRRTNDQWKQEAKLTPADGTAGDQFGNDVAIAPDDTIIVGAPGFPTNHWVDAGAVYVFQNDGEEWRETAKLTSDVPSSNELFGRAVAVDGNILAIGTLRYARPNSVYMFHGSGADWTLEANFADGRSRPQDYFSADLDVSGDTVLVGAPEDGEYPSQNGAVYVYQRYQNQWHREAKLFASDGKNNDDFGSAVAIEGNRALIGAAAVYTDNGRTGAAYVFRRIGRDWVEESKIVPDNLVRYGEMGGAAAMTAEGVGVVGAAWDSEQSEYAGAAYAIELNCPEHCLTLEVDHLIAGSDAILTVKGGIPGTSIAIVWGAKDGSRLIATDSWCGRFGFRIPVVSEKKRLIIQGPLDANGQLTRWRYVPDFREGYEIRFQAILADTCPAQCMSNIVTQRIQ